MRKHILTMALAAALTLCVSSCTKVLTYQSIIDHGIWESTDRERVFDKCVKALNESEYMILATDRDTGLVATDWLSLRLENVAAKYKINFVIPRRDEDGGGESARIYVKVKADWETLPGYTANKEATNARVNNAISENIRTLFDAIEKEVGKSASIGTSILEWD
jgi:hypothetical protein